MIGKPESTFTAPDGFLHLPLEEVTSSVGDQRPASETMWNDLVDDLLRLHELEDDWDGQGAEAPHPALIDGAIKLALYFEQKKTTPATRAIAGLRGTIYFEWQTPLCYYEVEVLSPVEAEYRRLPFGADRPEFSRFEIPN